MGRSMAGQPLQGLSQCQEPLDIGVTLGELRQPRLLAGAPRAVGATELDWILRDALRYW